MNRRVAPIGCRPWLLNGFSMELIESHYEAHYGPEVVRLNSIRNETFSANSLLMSSIGWADLKLEESRLITSVELHELYFASLGSGGSSSSALELRLSRDFGSFSRWKEEFSVLANRVGKSGWVTLNYLPSENRYINCGSNEELQTVPGSIPILALDMHPHAYQAHFDSDISRYVDVYLQNVSWVEAEQRAQLAESHNRKSSEIEAEGESLDSISVEEFRGLMETEPSLNILDVRLSKYVNRRPERIVGATMRNAEQIADWISEFNSNQKLVVYCAYGFNVSADASKALRELGLDARYLRGGYSGWKAFGGSIEPLE